MEPSVFSGKRGPRFTREVRATGSQAPPRRESFPVIFVVFQTGRGADGGVESITQVIERLRRVQPVIVTQKETPVNERWWRAGADVRVWSALGQWGPRPEGISGRFARKAHQLSSMVQTNWKIGALIHETGSRVVHCNDLRALLHTVAGARAAGASLVFNVRDVKRPEKRYGWGWQVTRLSHRQVALSKEMSRTLNRRLPLKSGDRVEYIYSIVDFDQMYAAEPKQRKALRVRCGIAEDGLAIGYVATFSRIKAQRRLIEEAGPLIKRRLPNAKVYFVGDFEPEHDAYAAGCQEAVDRLGLADVFEFVGYSSEIGDWYRAVDVSLLASRREGMARCMIEALACGTPVVSFDVCSAREILGQYDCGRVAPQGNYPQLVQHLEELADLPRERLRLGASGEQAARRLFDAPRIVEQYERLYSEMNERTAS